MKNSIWNKTLYTTRNGRHISVKSVLCFIGIIVVAGLTFKFVANIGSNEARHTVWSSSYQSVYQK